MLPHSITVVYDSIFDVGGASHVYEFRNQVDRMVETYTNASKVIMRDHYKSPSDQCNAAIAPLMDTLVSDIAMQTERMKTTYAERFNVYAARQQANFDTWIVDVVKRHQYYRPEGNEIKVEMFGPLLTYIVKYDNTCHRSPSRVEHVINGRLPPRSKLTGFKQYLKTAEAKRILTRQDDTITKEKYTIHSVTEVMQLALAFSVFLDAFHYITLSNAAKKQKMTDDNKSD